MKKITKFLKQGAKPILYVLIGFILGIAIYTAHAAWNTTVTPGELLTDDLWNDVVTKLIELDAVDGDLNTDVSDIYNEIDIINSTISCPCGVCWSTGAVSCFEDAVMVRLCTPAGWIITSHCGVP